MKLDEALKLAPIPAPSSELPGIDKAAIITMDKGAVTDANAEYPVIANWGASTCSVVFLYDKERKRLGAVHVSALGANNEPLTKLKELVREGDATRQLTAFVVGGLPQAAKDQGASSLDDVQRIVKALSDDPHVTIGHVDLFDKNKSQDHAMDARTGEFFYLQKGRTSLTRREMLTKKFPGKKEMGGWDLVYDGASKTVGKFTGTEAVKDEARDASEGPSPT